MKSQDWAVAEWGLQRASEGFLLTMACTLVLGEVLYLGIGFAQRLGSLIAGKMCRVGPKYPVPQGGLADEGAVINMLKNQVRKLEEDKDAAGNDAE